MLQKTFEITEQLYNPINHLTQNELMEKFNLAFYEGQNLSKADILSTFKDVSEESSTEDNTEVNEKTSEIQETNDEYLIDYLLSNSPVSTPSSDVDISFDFNDFVNDFDQNFSGTDSQPANDDYFDTETFSTESSFENDNKQNVFFPFLTPPPINCNKQEKTCLNNLDLGDIDIDEDLIDFEDLPADFQDIDDSVSESTQNEENYQYLPPIDTVTRNNMEFNNYLRNAAPDSFHIYNQVRNNELFKKFLIYFFVVQALFHNLPVETCKTKKINQNIRMRVLKTEVNKKVS